jgi:tetratricopeptide (TPR) repeat protein
MSARGAVDKVLVRARKEYDAGNYRRGVELLAPFVGPNKRKLAPQQERDVVDWLSTCYRFLDEYEAALPHAQRRLELALQLDRPRSRGHAGALEELSDVQTGLKAFPDARKAVTEALAIMDELGLQQDADYGGMLSVLGSVDREQGQHREALVTYGKAKALLAQHKDGHSYGVLVNNMALCHKALKEWDEAVACYKEAIEHSRNVHGNNHPDYAISLSNLARTYTSLQQHAEAVPLLEEALPIYRRVYGEQHKDTVGLVGRLKKAHRLALDARPNAVPQPEAAVLNNARSSLGEASERFLVDMQARLRAALEQEHARGMEERLQAALAQERARFDQERARMQAELDRERAERAEREQEVSTLRARLESQGKRHRSVVDEVVAVKRERLEQERECGLCNADDVQKCCLVPCGHVLCAKCAQ